MKGGEAQENKEGCTDVEIRGYRIVKKGIFTVSLAAFPSGRG
jgi:hypothetical protein